MNSIKIISMDFDGTLLTSEKKISDRTKKCLTELKDKSYTIIGVTARNLMSVKNVLDVSIFDYIILNNGSDIYYVKEDKVENVSSISKSIAEEIYNKFSNTSNQIDFCTSFKYLIRSNEKGDDRSFIKYIDDIDEVNGSISIMNVFFEDSDELDDNRKWIEDTY